LTQTENRLLTFVFDGHKPQYEQRKSKLIAVAESGKHTTSSGG
jgi:hypothetical protein